MNHHADTRAATLWPLFSDRYSRSLKTKYSVRKGKFWVLHGEDNEAMGISDRLMIYLSLKGNKWPRSKNKNKKTVYQGQSIDPVKSIHKSSAPWERGCKLHHTILSIIPRWEDWTEVPGVGCLHQSSMAPLRKLRQEDFYEFKSSLGNIMSSKPIWAT